jgi:diguanylate cyclase (GGDEF)-like protein
LTTLTALLLPWLSFLKLERSLTIKSQRDGLTKLANRTFFFSQVERHWLQYPQVKVVLMMIDIDHFKEINDKFGHHVGDIALKAVADIMSKGLRSHDLIGRIGGEEFAVILYNIELDVAQQIANRLCNQVMKQMAVIDGHNINLTISIGMVQVLPAHNQIHGAFKVADEALYHSKHSGRNTVTLGQLTEVSS